MKTETFDIGRCVVYDFCGKDWTDRPESGGFLFGSKAACPECDDDLWASIVEYGETERVRGRCAEGQPFADWVRELRGEDGNKIVVHELEEGEPFDDFARMFFGEDGEQ